MIWLIAKKDFLLNLLSVRFIIGFMLCLFVIPFTLIVSVDGYPKQVDRYKVEKENAENELKKIKVYSALRPTIVKEPAPLSIFSSGINDHIGTNVKIQLGEVPLFMKGHTVTRDNPFLNAFFSIDFATVIAILISLLALVFSYDAITREREDSTMKLVFTGQVSRITFLFGKLLGLLLTLLPILLFCYLLACLIVVVNPEIHFSATHWGGIVLLFFASILYMLVFILLGMFISSLTRNSSTSIIISLFCWIGFLFLIPNIASYLSQSIVKVQLYDQVRSAMSAIDQEYWATYKEKEKEIRQSLGLAKGVSHYNYNGGMDGYKEIYGGGRSMVEYHRLMESWFEPIRIDYADKKWTIQKKYLDELQQQQRMQQYLSWLSPSEIFKQTTQKLCGTDAGSYLQYMEGIRNYRETLIRYLKDTERFDFISYFTPAPLEVFFTKEEMEKVDMYNFHREGWDGSAYPVLNLDDVPRYTDKVVTLSSALGGALGRITSLVALVLALLLATIAAFMKYDVR